MWCYFKKIDENTVSCNLCNKHYKSSGNTSNMMKHLNMHNKHASVDKNDKSKELKSPTNKRKRKRSTEHNYK